jgi:glucose/arabinose dehydrogenase
LVLFTALVLLMLVVAALLGGPRAYDEINQVCGSGNYGWPYCQANNKPYFDYDFATSTTGRPSTARRW